MIELPPEIVWDYPEAPRDELWRLRRLAEFFPQFGRDVPSVTALYLRRHELGAPPDLIELVEMYARAWRIAGHDGNAERP